MYNLRHMRRRFERAATTFDDSDFVHEATRDGVLARLEPLTIDAKIVVDLGCATGAAQALLAKRFKGARILNVDIAAAMLEQARAKKGWFSKSSFLQADCSALPLADESVDVVFANLLLPWFEDPTPLLSEVARVLRKEGVFAFATLGPDSLREIAAAWRSVDDGAHVGRFPDMHDLGDGLVRAGLRDPVLDVDRLHVRYENLSRLLTDLTATGSRNCLIDRTKSLTGKDRFKAMRDALGETDLALDLELVYGHCWGAGPKQDPGNWRVDATQIGIRSR